MRSSARRSLRCSRACGRGSHDRRADLDPARRRGEPGEHRHGVGSPGLGGQAESYPSPRVLHDGTSPPVSCPRGVAEMTPSFTQRPTRLTSDAVPASRASGRAGLRRPTRTRASTRCARRSSAPATRWRPSSPRSLWRRGRRARRTFHERAGLGSGGDARRALRPLYSAGAGCTRAAGDGGRQLARGSTPFYTATPQDPHGSRSAPLPQPTGGASSTSRTSRSTATAVEGASVSDFLREALERGARGRMSDNFFIQSISTG